MNARQNTKLEQSLLHLTLADLAAGFAYATSDTIWQKTPLSQNLSTAVPIAKKVRASLLSSSALDSYCRSIASTHRHSTATNKCVFQTTVAGAPRRLLAFRGKFAFLFHSLATAPIEAKYYISL